MRGLHNYFQLKPHAGGYYLHCPLKPDRHIGLQVSLKFSVFE